MNRYQDYIGIMIGRNSKRRYETIYYPTFPFLSTDIYIVAKNVTRLDLLADIYYGDVRYWIVLARANKLNNATLRVKPGTRIRIPYPLDRDTIDKMFEEKQF